MLEIEDLLGTGRICDIINSLKTIYSVESTRQLSEEVKLDALLTSLQISKEDFDSLIADNSPVLRTIQGHAFEIVFEYILASEGYKVTDVGGDRDIDLIVNDFTLQLKTPYSAGSSGVIVQYKTHKTHGAKSERESMDYYHSFHDFADFLVGLISYEPLKIIFLSKSELPFHPKSTNHIHSPFSVNWYNHVGLNNFSLIGVDRFDLKYDKHIPTDFSKEILPKTSRRMNIISNIILDTILFESNFRIWDMAIRGWAREVANQNYFSSINIKLLNSSKYRASRADKSDFALKRKVGDYHFFQVKGVSTNNCSFNGKNSIIATETQLTRGRVNDHPTQSRLYLTTDFDFLILCVDPPLVKKFDNELGYNNGLYWKFYCIPTDKLLLHPQLPNRIKSLQKFNLIDIEKYRLDEEFTKDYL